MTQCQINNCVYRVPPPTLRLTLLAWIRHAIGELQWEMKQSHAFENHRSTGPSQCPSVAIEETRRFAERRILGALR